MVVGSRTALSSLSNGSSQAHKKSRKRGHSRTRSKQVKVPQKNLTPVPEEENSNDENENIKHNSRSNKIKQRKPNQEDEKKPKRNTSNLLNANYFSNTKKELTRSHSAESVNDVVNSHLELLAQAINGARHDVSLDRKEMKVNQKKIHKTESSKNTLVEVNKMLVKDQMKQSVVPLRSNTTTILPQAEIIIKETNKLESSPLKPSIKEHEEVENISIESDDIAIKDYIDTEQVENNKTVNVENQIGNIEIMKNVNTYHTNMTVKSLEVDTTIKNENTYIFDSKQELQDEKEVEEDEVKIEENEVEVEVKEHGTAEYEVEDDDLESSDSEDEVSEISELIEIHQSVVNNSRIFAKDTFSLNMDAGRSAREPSCKNWQLNYVDALSQSLSEEMSNLANLQNSLNKLRLQRSERATE